MRALVVLSALLAAAACAHPRDAATLDPAALSERWLVGAWAAEGESCASDAGIAYRADRTWIAQGAGGTWRIEGGSIVSLTTEQWEDGEPHVRLAQPERRIDRIEVTGRDAFVLRREDGSIIPMVRCPE